MSNTKDKQLLKEYVKSCLHEDTYGGYADAGITAADIAGASPYGMSYGSKSELVKTFIEPFTDVFKTAVGKSKEITRRAATMLPVAVGTILTTLIPQLGKSYGDVFESERKDLEKIKSQYKDVYERTNKALSSSDAAFLAFMASPESAMAAWGLSKAPSVIGDILTIASGGMSDKIFEKFKNANFADAGVATQKKLDKEAQGKKSSKKPGDFFGETLLREDEDFSKDDQIAKKIYSSKKFMDAVMTNSPKMKEMQQTATALYRDSLNDVYKQVDDLFSRARTIEDIKKLTKKQIPELAEIEKLQGQEKENAEKLILQGARKAMKDFYIKNLTDQVEGVIKAGIPEDSQYVKDFRQTIQKIKAL